MNTQKNFRELRTSTSFYRWQKIMPIKGQWQSRNWSPGGQSKGHSSVPCSCEPGVGSCLTAWHLGICLGTLATYLHPFTSDRSYLPLALPSRQTGFCFVSWIRFNSLYHFPSMCSSAVLVSRFLVFIGFAMHTTDIYLMPTEYQAVHLIKGVPG